MKALSLTQPWATLIALGDKRLNSPASHICAKGALSLWEWNEFPELEQ